MLGAVGVLKQLFTLCNSIVQAVKEYKLKQQGRTELMWEQTNEQNKQEAKAAKILRETEGMDASELAEYIRLYSNKS